MLCSHCLTMLWAGAWREGLFGWTSQLHLIALVSTILWKLRSLGVGGQFLSIVMEFLRDIRQLVCLDDKFKASLDVA